MTGIRTGSTRRYECAHLVCTYMLSQNLNTAMVTSSQIARFHNLSRRSSQSIGHMLNFLYTNHIREARFGFFIRGTLPLSKWDYPHHYTVELIDGARGLA
ncbi:MAG TPA: hypothetical protein VHN82_09415 [Methanoregula sp.]|nr:hypothetical protein [Methanoregula sp.]